MGRLRLPQDFPKLDAKWTGKWRRAAPDGSLHPAKHAVAGKKTYFALSMFPYPSGTLHLGHQRVYTISDVLSRIRRMQGFNVVHPMGWDAFGLPAENAAIERKISPKTWTNGNISKMKAQMHAMLADFDWHRELNTSLPEYYKWTQKLFLLMFENGLAYRKGAEINWDPVDKTVLANEQVDSEGRSWRSGAKVERRVLEQWFIGITKYAAALEEDLAKLGEWPDKVKTMQRNWIGKSEGAKITFSLSLGKDINVFTSRPDTLFSVQFLGLAATHPFVKELAKEDNELKKYIQNPEGGYRLSLKASLPIDFHGNPVQEFNVPIFVAPYVLGDYGEGAVMGCPAHDERDFLFWKEQGETELKATVGPEERQTTRGVLENVGPLSGLPSKEAGERITQLLSSHGKGGATTQFRIRDWLVSRQRYWGAPIPIVHCDSCGPVAVPDAELPVLLPETETVGGSLAKFESFVHTTCPSCQGPARRDTDTMDTFMDSSWYFFRFTDPKNEKELFSKEAAKEMPVDIYVGGVEHAILHLLYLRFVARFLGDIGMWEGTEPIKRLVTQGMVHGKTYLEPQTGRFLKPEEVKDGVIVATGENALVTFEKMSKSKYNGVDPGECIARYGADAVRAHILFSAPVSDVLEWNEAHIAGVQRWLTKVVNLGDEVNKRGEVKRGEINKRGEVKRGNPSKEALVGETLHVHNETQRYIARIAAAADQVENMNTMISDYMKLTNLLTASKGKIDPMVLRDSYKTLLILMAPVTPAVAEECWEQLLVAEGKAWRSIFFESFPESRPIESSEVKYKVMVDGKFRHLLVAPHNLAQLPHDEILRFIYANSPVAPIPGASLIAKRDTLIVRTAR